MKKTGWMLFSTSVFFILSFAFIIFSYWIDAFLLVATKIDGNYLFLNMPSMRWNWH